MASGAPGSESHTLLAQSRGEHGPSPSCALPWPEECRGAWHEDPGVPREGLKPDAVVEEGGKHNWGDSPRESRVGLGVRASPHQDPRAPPVPALSWQSGPGCIPWQPPDEGLRSQSLRAYFICLPPLAPAGLEWIPLLLPTVELCAEAPVGSSYSLPFGLGGLGCPALPPGLSCPWPLTPWGWWLQSSPGPARDRNGISSWRGTAVFVVCVLKRFLWGWQGG